MSCISAFICHWCGQEWVCNASQEQIKQGIKHKDGPCCCGSFCDCAEAQKIQANMRSTPIVPAFNINGIYPTY